MRRTVTALFFVLLVALVLVPVTLADFPQQNQNPDVYAEAVGTANLRAGPSTEFDIIGEIAAGTEYRVLRQHAQVPWLLLEVPGLATNAGWVFDELVQIKRGDLSTVPFETEFSELPVVAVVTPTLAASPDESATGAATSAVTATPTVPAPPPNLVTARLTGRSNVRYGPGLDYPTIATLDEGTVLTVLARHSLYPWYQVAVEGAPNGLGWVIEGVVEIEGDIASLPVITDTVLEFPTPSATPDTVVVAESPFGDFGSSSATLATRLGEPIHEFMLSQGLAPRTDREGSVFAMDLWTGEHFTLNGGVAYSGMSISKIPILVTYFRDRDQPLQTSDAELIANTMICSENITTNEIMTIIGDGDILAGAQRVTQTMLQMGLGNSFVVAPFDTGNPDATPAPVSSVQTGVDQQRTQPDAFNQLTVEEIGWLLGSIYQCAADGTGPLIDTFADDITQEECRQMIRVMSANKIGALIEAGVPPGTTVAHKHGWIDDTHGDAGIVFGVEGAYVLAMIYHERTPWLDYEKSFPVLEEIARQTWNYFNPNNTIDTTFPSDVPATCNIYAEPVIEDMLSGDIFIPTPTAQITESPTATATPTPNP